MRVQDVGEFAGHIACDEGSRSEIVVPVIKDGNVSRRRDVLGKLRDVSPSDS